MYVRYCVHLEYEALSTYGVVYLYRIWCYVRIILYTYYIWGYMYIWHCVHVRYVVRGEAPLNYKNEQNLDDTNDKTLFLYIGF